MPRTVLWRIWNALGESENGYRTRRGGRKKKRINVLIMLKVRKRSRLSFNTSSLGYGPLKNKTDTHIEAGCLSDVSAILRTHFFLQIKSKNKQQQFYYMTVLYLCTNWIWKCILNEKAGFVQENEQARQKMRQERSNNGRIMADSEVWSADRGGGGFGAERLSPSPRGGVWGGGSWHRDPTEEACENSQASVSVGVLGARRTWTAWCLG